MKIIRALSLALCVVLLLAGCGANNTQTDNVPDKQAEIAQKTEPAETKDTEESIQTTEMQNDTPFDWYAIKEKYPGPELPTSNVYVNRQCGYKLTVPESWLGWYFIEDSNPECLEIYFYGKSIAGTVLYLKDGFDEYNNYGQFLFYIMTEAELKKGTYDSIRKLGTINGINYYSATGTGATLALLSHNYEAWEHYEGEVELVKKDWIQGDKMDYYDIIFEPIEKGQENTSVDIYATEQVALQHNLNEIKENYPAPPLATDNVYVNRQCGYKLTVPESWIGWYYIEDTDPERLGVYFYGKSIMGSVWPRHLSDEISDQHKVYGIPMFYIISYDERKKGVYGSTRHFGEINGIDYCYATDYKPKFTNLVVLPDHYDAWADYEGEPELMKKDWEQVMKMKYDDIVFEPIQ